MNLSIIIPVYNVERYLAECLGSVLAQDVPGMEVICVDDGSTDSSPSILRSFAERDPRVSVIEKPNPGYGDSVNAGLDAARGEYVGIVESDDLAVPGMFARMLAIARETGADLVKGTFNFYTADPLERRLHPNFKDFPTGKIIDPAGWPELFYTAPSVWSALYRRDFLNGEGIRFLATPGASYQDTSFAFKVWAAARSAYLMPDPVIDYRQLSQGSSSGTSRKVFDIFNETAEMGAFLRERGLEKFFPHLVRTKFISYTWTLGRLDAAGRRKFLSRWVPELREEFMAGRFVRSCWDEYGWQFIHRLVLDTERAAAEICAGGGLSAMPAFDPVRMLPGLSPVYIYGAGKRALSVLERLRASGACVAAFVVSDLAGNPCNIQGIPVIPLDRMDRDGLIYLGVSGKYEGEVRRTLAGRWLSNNIVG